MPTTLTYGHQKPIQGEKGDTVFDALEANIDLDDSHTHNNINSPLITTGSIILTTGDILIAGWNVSGSDFNQFITIPTSLSSVGRIIGNLQLQFYLLSGANVTTQFYPTIDRNTDTSFKITVPFNDKDVRVIYS